MDEHWASKSTHKLVERLLEQRSDVVAFNIRSAEALGPTDQLAVVDTFLGTWVGEGEAERKVISIFVAS